MKIRKN